MLRREPEAPDGRREAELTQLFAQYREALPDPEPTPGFLPELWRRIEARQTSTRDLRRLAQGFVTAAALVSMLIGIFLAQPQGRVSAFYTNTYLEILATDQAQDDPVVAEIVQVEPISHENAQ
jgi:hypothetical protein